MECATVSDAQVPANNFLLLFVLLKIVKIPVIAPLDRVDCASVIEEIMVAAPLDRVDCASVIEEIMVAAPLDHFLVNKLKF